MIKLQNYTPDVYYKESRDFQFIGRLYDLVLNSAKTSADMIYDIPDASTAGSQMIDLLATTLGFKPKHEYSVKQLAAICSVFATVLREKGTIEAVELAGKALCHAEGLTDNFDCEVDSVDPYCLNVYLTSALVDTNLFTDLLDYILPAGTTCSIKRTVLTRLKNNPTTSIGSSDSIRYAAQKDYESSRLVDYTNENIANGITGLTKTDPAKQVPGTIENSTVIRIRPDSEQDPKDPDKP